jgi:small subunit ribosomal protein S6
MTGAIVPRRLAAAAREYELVLMLDPGQDAPARDALAQEARAQIEAAGALKHENSWGLRKMAYEIDQRNEADYRWFRFEAPTSLLGELDHNLKIADGVLRFRIFKVDPDAPVIVPPAGAAAGSSRERPAQSAPQAAPESGAEAAPEGAPRPAEAAETAETAAPAEAVPQAAAETAAEETPKSAAAPEPLTEAASEPAPEAAPESPESEAAKPGE